MAMGGWAMWLVLLLDGVLLAVVLLSLVAVVGLRVSGKMPGVSKGIAIVTLLICVLPGCAGLLGYWQGTSNVEAAVAFADPQQQAELREYGYMEAGYNLKFGGGSACCLLSLALLVVGVAMTQGQSYEVD
jgi:hypothetical protein